jgi:hypothetical protein
MGNRIETSSLSSSSNREIEDDDEDEDDVRYDRNANGR